MIAWPLLAEGAAGADVWAQTGAVASIALDLLTGVLAIATVALAVQTRNMARETHETIAVAREGAQYAERHHQESLSPALVLTAPRLLFDHVRPASRLTPEDGAVSGFAYHFQLRVDAVRNLGFGPALAIAVEIRTHGLPLSLSGSASIAPLAAGESRDDPIAVAMWSPERCEIPAAPLAGTVRLTYANVFRENRVTTYELRIEQTEDVPVTVVDGETIDDQRISDRPAIFWS
jgi:hypothetical protein